MDATVVDYEVRSWIGPEAFMEFWGYTFGDDVAYPLRSPPKGIEINGALEFTNPSPEAEVVNYAFMGKVDFSQTSMRWDYQDGNASHAAINRLIKDWLDHYGWDEPYSPKYGSTAIHIDEREYFFTTVVTFAL